MIWGLKLMRSRTTETIHKSEIRNPKSEIRVATSFSLRDYLRIILVRKWIVLLIFLASLGATFYYLKTATPIYQTQVLIMREEAEQLPASILGIAFTPRESLRSHMRLLGSSSSVADIKERLKNKYQLEVTVPQIIGNFSLAYDEDDMSIIELTATASIPKQAQALANIVAEFYIEKVAEMKSAHLDKGVRFLTKHIDFIDEKLQKSEEALNIFREKEGIWALSRTTSGGSIISGGLLAKLAEMHADLSKTDTDIEWAEAQLQSVQSLISERKKASLASLTTSLPPQVDQIQSKLVELYLQLDTLSEQFTEKDLEVMTVQRQIDALQKRLEEELAKLLGSEEQTSLDPLSELQGLVQQSISQNLQLRGLKQKAVILKQKIDTFKETHPELITQQVQLTRLERQTRMLEQTYTTLIDKQEEMLLLKEMKTGGLRILDQAALPLSPISPKKKQTLLFGLIIGFVLGVGIAFFLEYIDDSIKLKEDVERYLALPVMGTIPKISPFDVPESALSRRELSTDSGNGLNGLPRTNPRKELEKPSNGETSSSASGESIEVPINTTGQPEVQLRKRQKHVKGHRKRMKRLLSSIILYAEKRTPILTSYRTLGANIKYADVDTPIQSLLVTSAAPTEGKTSTVTNLAISMAQTGNKVLLIDTDLRRPRIHRIFQQDRSPGLTDFLTDENTSIEYLQGGHPTEEPFIRPTNIDNLYLFPCGTHVSNPEGLLSSEKMKLLIKSLNSEYDIILFDSPPLISAADAIILSTKVDATLMVVHSGKTKRHIALQGREMLENVDAKILGAVLNNIDYSKQYGSYYYYYYYYRSYYYSSDEEE